VGTTAGVLYFALEADVAPHAPEDDVDRREARPGSTPERFDAPLVRLSRTHVGVRAHAVVLRGDAGPLTQRDVTLLLDTGLTVAIATPDGERALDLHVGSGPTIASHGVSGHVSDLPSTGDTERALVSVAPWTSPLHVGTPLGHLGPDRLDGAHAILPPHLLGPRGGAVRLDFRRSRFATCETVRACQGEGEWAPLGEASCHDYPDVLVVPATLAGAPVRLLLDTGGSTLVSRRFADAHDLAPQTTGNADGHIIGSGGGTLAAKMLEGAFAFGLGPGARLTRTARSLWVPEALGGAPADCGLDGTLGIDVLAGCALVIADGSPLRASIQCDPGAAPGTP
jgi:hypothetical protein